MGYANPSDNTEFTQGSQDEETGGTGTAGDGTQDQDADGTQTDEEATEADPSETDEASEADSGEKSNAKASKKSKKSSEKSKKKTQEDEELSAKERAKVASAKEAIDEMLSLSAQLETAYEDLNEQKAALKKAKKAIAKTKAEIKTASRDMEDAQQKAASWVKEIYVNGTVRYLAVLLNATTFGDFLDRFIFCNRIAEEAQAAVDKVKTLKGKLSEENQKLADRYSEKKALTAKAQASAETIQQALLEQASYYSGLPAKVRKAVKNYDGVKNALSSAAAVTGSTSKEGSHPEVVTEALKYLGVDYVWGGETPSGFDCSGLVMYCYEKACGISLTHYARTQYSEGMKVAKSALMPGDLVFFGPSVEGIHHVGIYMGNDKFIHAPQTGDVVKISTLSNRSDFIGACRPLG